MAQAAGFEVRAFVSDETRPMVERFNIPAEYIGPVTPPGTGGLMGDVAEAAGTLRHAWAARRFENEYWVPLILSLADGLHRFRDQIAAFGPDLILEDSHVIGWIYRDVAPSAPHVIHVAAGSHFSCQEAGALEEGFWPRLRAWVSDRRLNALYSGMLRMGRVLKQRNWVTDQVLRNRLEEEKAAARARSKPVVEKRISTGMGVLEEESLADRIHLCDGIQFFGSVDPNAGASLEPALAEWLESSDRPVALVSFGSMIPSDTEVGRAVGKGLEQAGVRVLWVSGGNEAEKIAGKKAEKEAGSDGMAPRGDVGDLRTEAFIPQADVLAHPNVRVFVTHAGSGGVQDGVWNGKPFLCIPMVSDQPYNARVVEFLGGGITIPAREVSASRVGRALRRLLTDDAFGSGALDLSRRMREKEGGRQVVELLEEVADTR